MAEPKKIDWTYVVMAVVFYGVIAVLSGRCQGC